MQVVRVNNAHLAAIEHESNTHHETTLYRCPKKRCPCKQARCAICEIEWRSPKVLPAKKEVKG